jgi:threonine/homoserine/homoserine lactone efflux protein
VDIIFLFKGIILGLCISAPIGPVGVICIRRTLHYGRLSGFFSGLGATIADTVFAIVSAFGLSLVSDFIDAKRFWLLIFGGLFLCYLGIQIFFSKPAETRKTVSHKTLIGDFLSTFLLTVANPLIILIFFAVFAGLGLSEHQKDAIPLVLGVFLGTLLWWIVLGQVVALVRRKIGQRTMVWINRVAGLIILSFGIFAISQI